jgi:hypothetical protein
MSTSGSPVFFQFSLEDKWEAKLKRDAEKIVDYGHSISGLVFVTSQGVTGEKQDKLRAEFKTNYGWELKIFPREWLRHRLEERHPDLAEKHLGVSVPVTPHHAEMILTSTGVNEESEEQLFRGISPEMLKANLLNKVKDGKIRQSC